MEFNIMWNNNTLLASLQNSNCSYIYIYIYIYIYYVYMYIYYIYIYYIYIYIFCAAWSSTIKCKKSLSIIFYFRIRNRVFSMQIKTFESNEGLLELNERGWIDRNKDQIFWSYL